ncbi:hypothetical protein F5Y19DRAFT_472063 [Xylariaceae sp. FL1651]|nr:hypothetical protein F5Y19DRAFT_472063 [Xylariaceae sp. FL1651]
MDVTEIDVRGDLRLVVGTGPEAKYYRVCSRALARASLVFKEMLYGKSDTANTEPVHGIQDAKWLVTLAKDDPAAMKMALDIMHCEFGLAILELLVTVMRASLIKFSESLPNPNGIVAKPSLTSHHSS